MNAATSFSPAALQIFELFKTLPVDEQESVRENLSLETEEGWPWDLLNERQKLHEQGLDPAIPWEEAKQHLRKKWAAR